MKAAWAGLVLLLATSAYAQAEPVAPTLKESSAAEYPTEALRDHIEGEVGLALSIDATGHVTDARVTKSAGRRLRRVALATAEEVRVHTRDAGRLTIASTVDCPMPFKLPKATRQS